MKTTKETAPTLLDLPVGIDAEGTRTETDSLGAVEVPAGRYWGAQTQRSLEHFRIGGERMPLEVYRAYGQVKKAAARVNARHGLIPTWMADLIGRVCDEIEAGALDAEFPLFVWQTGSGTQTNMNVNEVISNRCIQLVGGRLGSGTPVHPNDHVNRSQSSNDTFPTAMHIAGHRMVVAETIPALEGLRDAISSRAERWAEVVRIGRTHLQDATPLSVGQQWSGYAAALDDGIRVLAAANGGLLAIALGGTAVGTGLNTPAGFDREAAEEIAGLTGHAFHPAPNKFAAQATLDPMARSHSALKGVAVSLFKIVNDIRWFGSGPRAGIGELILPANEPGSSIMPGKVNPTQCEAALKSIERLAAAVGDRVQVAFVSGTDFGTQTGQFCSVQTYRELYKPFHRAVNDHIHKLTKWKTFIHSCGAVRPFIADFIEAGFDVLNPVQCSATGMDARELKSEFGRDLVFWGGGVDTQHTLPFGTPDEVYRQVRERIEILGEGGGFVFNSIHNVQSNVPTENMLALFRAVKDSR